MRFKYARHNVFTEEINKIRLSLNDDKRKQSIDSIETFTYRRNKDLVSGKEEIKCNSVIKGYKKWLNFVILQKKKQKKIIQIDHKFLIILIE